MQRKNRIEANRKGWIKMEGHTAARMAKDGMRAILSRFGWKAEDSAANTEKRENEWILTSLNLAKREWEAAENRFNEVTVPELLDAAAYQIMAEKSKYEYLVKRAKERNLHF